MYDPSNINDEKIVVVLSKIYMDWFRNGFKSDNVDSPNWTISIQM